MASRNGAAGTRDGRSAAAAARRPPLDDQCRRLTIEMYEHDLCDISDEHLARECTFIRDHSIGHRSTTDLRLTRPRPFVAVDRIDGRAVKRESRVPLKISELTGVRHRTEGQTAVCERAFDARDPR